MRFLSLQCVVQKGLKQLSSRWKLITRRETKSTGDGPVDATFNAIKELTGYNARLRLYQVHAVTEVLMHRLR